MPDPPLIRLDQITKSYTTRSKEKVAALTEISLDVSRGMLLAIVGPTGCGKTTLLRLMAGLERPDSGHIEVSAISREGHPPLAYLTQEHSLFPWLSVRKNIEMPMIVRGDPRPLIQKTANGLATTLGLGDYLGLYPHELSGGMQQRTAIARLLATQADIWLMDEPFSSLDERTRHALQDLLLQVQRERRFTIVFVTHSIDEAVYLADRVLVLSAGPGRVAATFDLASEKPRDRVAEAYGWQMEQIRRVIERVLA